MQNMGSIFLKLDFFITYVPTRASGVAVVAEPREKNPVSLLSKVLPSGPPQPSAMEQTIDDAALRLQGWHDGGGKKKLENRELYKAEGKTSIFDN